MFSNEKFYSVREKLGLVYCDAMTHILFSFNCVQCDDAHSLLLQLSSGIQYNFCPQYKNCIGGHTFSKKYYSLMKNIVALQPVYCDVTVMTGVLCTALALNKPSSSSSSSLTSPAHQKEKLKEKRNKETKQTNKKKETRHTKTLRQDKRKGGEH